MGYGNATAIETEGTTFGQLVLGQYLLKDPPGDEGQTFFLVLGVQPSIDPRLLSIRVTDSEGYESMFTAEPAGKARVGAGDVQPWGD
ncbi:hypothetical protein [Caenimonas aquaedulcis]|uniref:Uncharacterized protein n=1 Tax=Caenimonas aquaedulcis TaxID=2793270 RepID=A0A931H4M6_9BURK|nr:hypothetical protein [Caenimonas aquaedulcis]MBG9388453.1 hypothetical protein [Caenimonas aquaedulcis]